MGSKTRSEIKESVKPKVECYADESRQENVLLTGRHMCVSDYVTAGVGRGQRSPSGVALTLKLGPDTCLPLWGLPQQIRGLSV